MNWLDWLLDKVVGPVCAIAFGLLAFFASLLIIGCVIFGLVFAIISLFR